MFSFILEFIIDIFRKKNSEKVIKGVKDNFKQDNNLLPEAVQSNNKFLYLEILFIIPTIIFWMISAATKNIIFDGVVIQIMLIIFPLVAIMFGFVDKVNAKKASTTRKMISLLLLVTSFSLLIWNILPLLIILLIFIASY